MLSRAVWLSWRERRPSISRSMKGKVPPLVGSVALRIAAGSWRQRCPDAIISYMTLEQLRVFVEVAERQHMTRAANSLHLTQSAVSAAVAALEARHGAKLFH